MEYIRGFTEAKADTQAGESPRHPLTLAQLGGFVGRGGQKVRRPYSNIPAETVFTGVTRIIPSSIHDSQHRYAALNVTVVLFNKLISRVRGPLLGHSDSLLEDLSAQRASNLGC